MKCSIAGAGCASQGPKSWGLQRRKFLYTAARLLPVSAFIPKKKALQYTQYDNLLKYTQRAYQLKTRRGAMPEARCAAQAAALHSELESGIQVINLNWLREKVLELTGSAR